MPALLRVMQLWQPQAPVLFGGLGMVLLSAGALAAVSLGAGAAPLAAAGILMVGLRAAGAGRVVLRYLERLVTHAATFRALTALRIWMFHGLARRSGGGLGFLARGDALARLVGDVDALDGLYLRIVVPLFATVVLVLALAAVLGAVAPALAVAVAVLLAAAAIGFPGIAARATLAEGSRLAEAQAGLLVAALDTLGGMREVRAFNNEGQMLALVQAREAALFAAQRRVSRVAALTQVAALLCAQAAVLLVVMADLPAPVLLPALLLTLAAFEAASAMPRAGALAGRAAGAAARVVAAAEAPGLQPADPARPAPLPRGAGLRFDAVRYAWPGRAPVFDGLTIDIPAGSRVAILGPSGSGKSTLAALALKVVAPDSGRVLLGGVDLATLPAEAIRSRFAWLSQSTHVFADTLRANLLLGRAAGTAADDAALWHALTQAGLDDVVRALPDGLDSWIGEGGGRPLRRAAPPCGARPRPAVRGTDPDPRRARHRPRRRGRAGLPRPPQRGRGRPHRHTHRPPSARRRAAGPHLAAEWRASRGRRRLTVKAIDGAARTRDCPRTFVPAAVESPVPPCSILPRSVPPVPRKRLLARAAAGSMLVGAALAGCAPKAAVDAPPRSVVFFTNFSADLDADARQVIDQVSADAVASPRRTVVVEGFADQRVSSPAATRTLSQLRAQVVADAIAAHGVDRSRIVLHPRGGTNSDPGIESRRVDVSFGS